MENATLVFIIIALGIVVVWQTSKLKQYERFEKLLPDQRPDGSSRQSSGQSGADGAAQPDQAAASASARTIAELADAQSAVHRATGEGASISQSAGGSAFSGAETADDNIEEAKRVQLVMARCHYADFYVDQLDDDYERDQFRRIVDDCTAISRRIADPFLQATALQPLILLMQRAGWDERQAALMNEVRDDLVRQRIESALAREAAEEA